MSIDAITQIMADAMYTVLITALPPLLISMIVGLAVSIFQTVTSIQEQTLTFVPKLLAIFLVLIIGGSWMLNNMITFMENLWADFSLYIH